VITKRFCLKWTMSNSIVYYAQNNSWYTCKTSDSFKFCWPCISV